MDPYLPGEGPSVGVRVPHSLLDSFLEQSHVFLQGVGGPRVEQLVKELTDVSSDLLGLGGNVLADDWKEPGAGKNKVKEGRR